MWRKKTWIGNHFTIQKLLALLSCQLFSLKHLWRFSMHQGLDWSSQPHARVARGNLQETIRILYGHWHHSGGMASQCLATLWWHINAVTALYKSWKAGQGHSLTSLLLWWRGFESFQEVTLSLMMLMFVNNGFGVQGLNSSFDGKGWPGQWTKLPVTTPHDFFILFS